MDTSMPVMHRAPDTARLHQPMPGSLHEALLLLACVPSSISHLHLLLSSGTICQILPQHHGRLQEARLSWAREASTALSENSCKMYKLRVHSQLSRNSAVSMLVAHEAYTVVVYDGKVIK